MELVGIAQPAMRRVLARTPPVPEPGSRSKHVAAPCCITRRGNAHRTEIAEEREVLYRWHPWAGCVVQVHEAVEKAGRIFLRCSRDIAASERWLELPAWMFDRATCVAIRITSDPVVEFAALVALHELLAEAAAPRETALSLNSPVLSPAGEARNQNRRKHNATTNSMSCDGPPTSRPAGPVRHSGADERALAGSDMAGVAGRDAAGADGINIPALARPRLRRKASAPNRGGR